MSAYTDYIDIWTTDDLRKQILFACMNTANYILTAEPNNAPNHNARVNWAKTVIFDPCEAAQKMSVAVICNGEVQAGNPPDATVQYVVDLMVNTFAEL